MWWPLFEYSTGYLMGMGYSLDEMGMLALCPMLAVAAIVTSRTCRCRRGQNQVDVWQLKIFFSILRGGGDGCCT